MTQALPVEHAAVAYLIAGEVCHFGPDSIKGLSGDGPPRFLIGFRAARAAIDIDVDRGANVVLLVPPMEARPATRIPSTAPPLASRGTRPELMTSARAGSSSWQRH
ncbi:MAG: hypothetical protein E5Y06_00825 [Mesorhizobium sp.]|uniref:hypothetical protein n=1 Tax=Mesorhizobium sp. TaxID=1871066 RepID=UPI001204E06A|nr:hypothetical protein [Mesorhizobium sp.]TIN98519.1 MAG: hypothetical protein E5Y06_00825 [Mesorhizobium sp.]TJU99108.1 MAG: hypothetical protein E5Y08_09510 [Mesorhizobium sp.]